MFLYNYEQLLKKSCEMLFRRKSLSMFQIKSLNIVREKVLSSEIILCLPSIIRTITALAKILRIILGNNIIESLKVRSKIKNRCVQK